MKNLVLLFLLTSFSFKVQAQEAVQDSSYFLAASYFEAKGLTQIQNNKQLRVYQNKSGKESSLERVVDIRWVFGSKTEAEQFFKANIGEQSENGFPYQRDLQLPNASVLKIYREDPMSASMYNSMLEQPLVHWYFIFVVDRVMTKIFIQGKRTQLEEAYLIASDAAKHIAGELKLDVDSVQKIPDAEEREFLPEFANKIEKANLAVYPPPGFISSTLPAQLDNYYDQQFSLPGEELVLRYFITESGAPTEEQSNQNFIRDCQGQYFSVAMNIMMDMKNPMPPTKEMTDTASCKKLFNGDYLMESFFEVGKKSELAKGYKYCYMYAIFRKDRPTAFVIFLENEKENLALFPQLLKRSVKFED